MSSKLHQFILVLLVRKAMEKGYFPIAYHGKEKLFPGVKFKIPPTIRRHKPDLVAIDLVNRRICIADAKTDSDLTSERTKEQIMDFSNLKPTKPWSSECIIGVPKRSEQKFVKLLKKWGLSRKNNLSYIFVPEELSD